MFLWAICVDITPREGDKTKHVKATLQGQQLPGRTKMSGADQEKHVFWYVAMTCVFHNSVLEGGLSCL